jgi:hypothetical protein
MHLQTLFAALTLGATTAAPWAQALENPVVSLYGEPVPGEINIEVQYRVF